MVSGLAAMVTLPLPFVLGRGGMVSGLAIATVVTAAMAAIRTAPRMYIDLLVMVLRSSVEKELRIQRVTRKWDIRYPKSNIARNFF
jgi:hypothetical protein